MYQIFKRHDLGELHLLGPLDLYQNEWFNIYTGSQEPVPGLNPDLLLDQLKYFTFKLQNIVLTVLLLSILCYSCREYTFANVIGVDYIYSKLQNFRKMINGAKIFQIFQIFVT